MRRAVYGRRDGSVAAGGRPRGLLSAHVRIAAACVLVLSAPLLARADALEVASRYEPRPELNEAPDGMLYRWISPFYMAIPSDWKPTNTSDPVGFGPGFFTGVHPDQAEFASADEDFAAVSARRLAPFGKGGPGCFAEFLEEDARRGRIKDLVLQEAESNIGGRRAMLYSYSAEVATSAGPRKREGRIVVSAVPESDGKHTIVHLYGSASTLDKLRRKINKILISAREANRPLVHALSFPYDVGGDIFDLVYGPAAAADGSVAVGEGWRRTRVRVFERKGKPVAEWGSVGDGEDGIFNNPKSMVFAPDGSLCILDEGFSEDSGVRRFSRAGKSLGRIRVDKQALGEDGIDTAWFMTVLDSGKVVVAGSSEKFGEARRFLVFSQDGELLAKWDSDPTGALASYPGDRLVVTRPNPKSEKNPVIAVVDLEGRAAREWSMYGIGLPPARGDEDVRFEPKYLAADARGWVYALDSRHAVWMYDEEGRFMYAVPLEPEMSTVNGMAVRPNGELVLIGRTDSRKPGEKPGEPLVHLFGNAFPFRREEDSGDRQAR